MEVQSLSAIFGDDLKVLGRSPWSFSVVVKPTSDDETSYVSVKLLVTMKDGYPESAPEIAVQLHEGLSNSHREALQKSVNAQVEELLGMSMLFDITESVKEYLIEHNKEANPEPASGKKGSGEDSGDTKEEILRASAAAKRAYVSPIDWIAAKPDKPVTKENFVKWKAAFERENLSNTTVRCEVKRVSKLSGREIFERDAKLGLAAAPVEGSEPADEKLFYFNESLYDDDDDDLDELDDGGSDGAEAEAAGAATQAGDAKSCGSGAAKSTDEAASAAEKKSKKKKKKRRKKQQSAQ